MFILFTGERWTDIMTEGMRMHTDGPMGQYSAVIFFVLSYLFFNLVMTNMFIAVILDNFATPDAVKSDLQLKGFEYNARLIIGGRTRSKDQQNQESDSHNYDELLSMVAKQEEMVQEEEEGGTIFGCLAPASKPNETKNLRGLVQDVLENSNYQRLLMTSIILSCIVLILDSPIPAYSNIDNNLAQLINLITFVLFTLEMVLKILHRGIFWEHPLAYFRSGWNILDFIVIVAQALDMLQVGSRIAALKVVRVLRPLRLLNRVKLLKLLINVIHHSMTDCCIIAIMFVFVLVLCAILAQTLFAGSTFSCSDDGQGVRVSYLASACNPAKDPFSCDPRGFRRAKKIEWRQDCRGYYFSDYAQTKTRATSVQGQIPSRHYYVSKGDRNEIMRPRVWSRALTHNYDSFGFTLHTFIQVPFFLQEGLHSHLFNPIDSESDFGPNLNLI